MRPEELRELADMEESRMLSFGERKIFAEVLRKPARLVICGGGHVAQQVVSLAKRTGFTVTVLEDRPYFADEARRAGADQVICQDFSKGLNEISGNSDTYFLVVTRGHRYDGNLPGIHSQKRKSLCRNDGQPEAWHSFEKEAGGGWL